MKNWKDKIKVVKENRPSHATIPMGDVDTDNGEYTLSLPLFWAVASKELMLSKFVYNRTTAKCSQGNATMTKPCDFLLSRSWNRNGSESIVLTAYNTASISIDIVLKAIDTFFEKNTTAHDWFLSETVENAIFPNSESMMENYAPKERMEDFRKQYGVTLPYGTISASFKGVIPEFLTKDWLKWSSKDLYDPMTKTGIKYYWSDGKGRYKPEETPSYAEAIENWNHAGLAGYSRTGKPLIIRETTFDDYIKKHMVPDWAEMIIAVNVNKFKPGHHEIKIYSF